MKFKFPRQILKNHSSIKFYENQSSESQIVPWELMDRRTEGQTDMTELTVAVRNFENAPKMYLSRL
jgi:hypothetical protein